MERNELEGTIPETLANLVSLVELNLLGNKFQSESEYSQSERVGGFAIPP